MHVCICVFCACSFVSERFHVSFRDLRPPKFLFHACSLQKSFAPAVPAVISCCPPFCFLQQLIATGYYWSALTSISAHRGMSHQICTQKTHKHTQSWIFVNKKLNSYFLLMFFQADNHSLNKQSRLLLLYLFLSSPFSLSCLNDRGNKVAQLHKHVHTHVLHMSDFFTHLPSHYSLSAQMVAWAAF